MNWREHRTHIRPRNHGDGCKDWIKKHDLFDRKNFRVEHWVITLWEISVDHTSFAIVLKNGGVAEVWQRLAPASTYLWHPFFCFSCFNCSRYVNFLLWLNKIVSELTLSLAGDDIFHERDRIVCVFNANRSLVLISNKLKLVRP